MRRKHSGFRRASLCESRFFDGLKVMLNRAMGLRLPEGNKDWNAVCLSGRHSQEDKHGDFRQG